MLHMHTCTNNHIFLHSPSAPTLTHTSAAMNKHTTVRQHTYRCKADREPEGAFGN